MSCVNLHVIWNQYHDLHFQVEGLGLNMSISSSHLLNLLFGSWIWASNDVFLFAIFVFPVQPIDYEGFRLFMATYLENDIPEELCQHLFTSFKSKTGVCSSDQSQAETSLLGKPSCTCCLLKRAVKSSLWLFWFLSKWEKSILSFVLPEISLANVNKCSDVESVFVIQCFVSTYCQTRCHDWCWQSQLRCSGISNGWFTIC